MSEQIQEIRDIPKAIHRGEDELPFVPLSPGVTFQLMQVDINLGFWAVRTKFDAGTTVQKHRHTGTVFAYTTSGAWRYLEYPEVNTPGSYLYEPAGSIHTLHALPEIEGTTDVFFAIYGANLNLDENGNIDSILDAAGILKLYYRECEKAKLPLPNVIGGKPAS
mgnify:CR=1 FL=1|tara:strand:- start:682 stop:1173 length:492 start_codon:yes stop_codon:yes gene_type:complete